MGNPAKAFAMAAKHDTSNGTRQRDSASYAALLDALDENIREPIEEILRLVAGKSTTFLNALSGIRTEEFYFLVPDTVVQLRRPTFSLTSSGSSPVEMFFFNLSGDCTYYDAKRYEPAAAFLMKYPDGVGRTEAVPLKGKPSFLRLKNVPPSRDIAPLRLGLV
jgi:hypothetical protein